MPTKTQSKKQTQEVAPVVAAAAAVVAAPAVAPKAAKGKKAADVAVAAPAVVAAPVAQEGGAKASPKAKGAKAAKAEAAPAAPVAPVVAAPVAQEGGAKPVKAKAAKSKAPKAKDAKQAKAAKAPKAKAAKAKEPKQAKGKKAAAATETAGEENSEELEGGKRSFKAKLPGSEKFEGRYTGLTPYQAANKALSKYYREAGESVKTNSEITFSIRESTRGSKRTVYTYNGRREKLATPVEYTIKGKDGERTVTKEYKNRLTKVKKAEVEADVAASA